MKKILKHIDFIVESFSINDSKEKNILDDVKWIIMQEYGISEKNFRYINAMNRSFDKFMKDVRLENDYISDIKSFENKRSTYAAEFIFDKYFKGKFKIES